MRLRFYPPTADQIGGDLSAYKGEPYYYNQDGAGVGSLLRGVWRVVKPLAISVAEGLGEQAEKSGHKLLDSAVKELATRQKRQKGRGIQHERSSRTSIPLKIRKRDVPKKKKAKAGQDSLGPLYFPVHK